MKNSIKISTQFDFKGKAHTPEMVVDLDVLMARNELVPNFHLMLATENRIGLYSYEFEVLESSELVFSEATGMAGEFLTDNLFDYRGFRERWQTQQQIAGLREIALEHLGEASLEQHPALQAALLAAYRLGQESHD